MGIEDFGNVEMDDEEDDLPVAQEASSKKNSSEDSEEAKSLSIIKPSQWVYCSHNSFKPSSKTINKLESGYYGIGLDRNDNVIYTKKKLEIDNLFNFHGSFLESILLDIENFWNKRNIFKKFGFLHRRGYLFYGIQGGGKTSLVHQILANITKRDGIVFEGSGKSPDIISIALKQFREIESKRNIVCLFEDIDAIIRECGESKFLSLVDGEDSINHVLYIATCFPPNIRMLTSDLRWVPCGELKEGDELWSFDSDKPKKRGARRRYRKAKVLVSKRARKECVKLYMNNGESIICTKDHPWLASYDSQQKSFRLDWVQAKDILSSPNLVRPFIPWEIETSHEAGWLAGILDGEGSVTGSGSRRDKNGRAGGVNVAQNKGLTADKIFSSISKRVDVHYYERKTRKGMMVLETRGGMNAAANLIGRVRAERLINQFDITDCMMLNKFPTRVIKIEDVGIQEIQSIQTSTGTYIAEGFACHNTNFPERLDKRIVARPRRFDRVIKIDPPNDTIRKEYFSKKLQINGEELEKYVKASENFTFAAMTELVISTKCLDVDFNDAVKVIKDLMLKKVSSEDYNNPNKVGFSEK